MLLINDNQSAALTNAYAYVDGPSVSSITPSGGHISGGNVAYIVGRHFRSTDIVNRLCGDITATESSTGLDVDLSFKE